MSNYQRVVGLFFGTLPINWCSILQSSTVFDGRFFLKRKGDTLVIFSEDISRRSAGATMKNHGG